MSYWGRRRSEAQKRYRLEVDACFGQAVNSPFDDLRDGLVLGGERLKDLAAAFGYADGSGILCVVQRVDARSKQDPRLARRLKELQAAMQV